MNENESNLTSQPAISPSHVPGHAHSDKAIVCYCYKKTCEDLKELHAKYGSLVAMQNATNIGNVCGGCRIVLRSLFSEETTDIYELSSGEALHPKWLKPGSKVMTAFVMSNDLFETSVYSCNAVAPQFGDGKTSEAIEYALVSHSGEVLFHRNAEIKTNHTFQFDTRSENLPRPFVGTLVVALGRANFGAGRLNIQWISESGITATHENTNTGRPRLYLPFLVDKKFQSGPNTIWTGLLNPFPHPTRFTLSAFEPDANIHFQAESFLNPFGAMWVNLSETLFATALREYPSGSFTARLQSETIERPIVLNFFIHNKNTNIWTAQHL